MQPTAKTVARFLKLAGEMVELLTDDQLKDFMKTMPRKAVAVRSPVTRLLKEPLSEKELQELERELDKSSSRENAMELLLSRSLSRQDLVALGKKRSAHITKQDQVSHIREKLVEAFVGARLSSNAIRGN